jgi:hypothetical protein
MTESKLFILNGMYDTIKANENYIKNLEDKIEKLKQLNTREDGTIDIEHPTIGNLRILVADLIKQAQLHKNEVEFDLKKSKTIFSEL